MLIVEEVKGQTQQGYDRTTTFVLMHSAWHGSWCWNTLTPRLRAAGHHLVTPTAELERVEGAFRDLMRRPQFERDTLVEKKP